MCREALYGPPPATLRADEPLASFREWGEIHAPHLIGRRFVPRGQLQAAVDGYVGYVAWHTAREESP